MSRPGKIYINDMIDPNDLIRGIIDQRESTLVKMTMGLEGKKMNVLKNVIIMEHFNKCH